MRFGLAAGQQIAAEQGPVHQQPAGACQGGRDSQSARGQHDGERRAGERAQQTAEDTVAGDDGRSGQAAAR